MAKPIIIKKYANRRLYNTQTSSYVTLDDIYQMVKNEENFEVKDAKSGEDITHQVLTQIIFENNRSEALMPTSFLRQLIRLYDDSLQNVVPHYLENSMNLFTQNRENMVHKAEEVMNTFNPLAGTPWEELQKQNMEMLHKSIEMFNPFSDKKGDDKDQIIANLQAEIKKLNQKVEELSK